MSDSTVFVSSYVPKRSPERGTRFSVGNLSATDLATLASSPVGRKLGIGSAIERAEANAVKAAAKSAPVKRSRK
jgi:hypothetical protein